MEMHFAARRERLLTLRFTELEIADVSETGLALVHSRLRQELRKERRRREHGSTLHVASHESLLFAALQAERKITGKIPGPSSRYAANGILLLNAMIGSNIAEARVEAERSRDWLAHILSCSHIRVERIEAGEVQLTTSDLAAIAKALSVTVLDLIPNEMRLRLQKPAPASPEQPEQFPRSAPELQADQSA